MTPTHVAKILAFLVLAPLIAWGIHASAVHHLAQLSAAPDDYLAHQRHVLSQPYVMSLAACLLFFGLYLLVLEALTWLIRSLVSRHPAA